MATYENPAATVTIDQASSLAPVVERLAREFDGAFSVETIERFVRTSYSQLATSAKVPTFLPVLSERFTRQRLRALSKVDGVDATGKPTVLFLCVHNAGRSQMALGFFQHYAGDAAVAWSGGSEPGNQVNPVAIEVMAEKGIDISEEYPKPWTDEIVKAADVVVTMGCGDECPYFPGKRYVDWVLKDPAGQDADVVREVRDEIEQRVVSLLGEIGVSAAVDSR